MGIDYQRNTPHTTFFTRTGLGLINRFVVYMGSLALQLHANGAMSLFCITILRDAFMIYSFGLHWKESDIHWGAGSDAGHLNGVKRRSKYAHPIDFREIRGIYALYSEYELMYIGQTGTGQNDRLFNRLKSHRTDHLAERWNRFSWFGFQRVIKPHNLSIITNSVKVEPEIAFNVLEAVVIAIAEPRLNLQRGRWGKACQYYQLEESNED
ncbi:MAG: GIY-YIG nuclease family protein [bacterium]|nr:GIY-YIG nuclease family protein [bacterium]